MNNRTKSILVSILGLVLLGLPGAGVAGYKARDWSVNLRENYAASLTSEGVTIAVEPL